MLYIITISASYPQVFDSFVEAHSYCASTTPKDLEGSANVRSIVKDGIVTGYRATVTSTIAKNFPSQSEAFGYMGTLGSRMQCANTSVSYKVKAEKREVAAPAAAVLSTDVSNMSTDAEKAANKAALAAQKAAKDAAQRKADRKARRAAARQQVNGRAAIDAGAILEQLAA